MKKAFAKALDMTERLLGDFVFKCNSRVKPQYFSRESKMGFKDTMLFMLNQGKRTLQLELNIFFRKLLKRQYTIKVSSYKENREKIDPEAFNVLNNELLDIAYSCKDYKHFKDFRLLAVDGSVFEIPNTKLLKKDFGEAKNQAKSYARARGLCVYDVLNELVIASKICKYTQGERSIAKEVVKTMVEHKKMLNDLFIFDRGFVQKDLIAYLLECNVNVLFRMPRNAFREIKNANKEDQLITLTVDNKDYKLRVVRFLLPSGEEEILLTSLTDEKYTLKVLEKLYFLRWGVEINYDILKNKLEIENFSSRSMITVEQDFYCSIFLRNMAALAKRISDSKIRKRYIGSNNKYDYKTNTNMLIGTFMEDFAYLLLVKSKRKRSKILRDMIHEIAGSVIPIRPNRSFERKKYKSTTKYKTNQKRCL